MESDLYPAFPETAHLFPPRVLSLIKNSRTCLQYSSYLSISSNHFLTNGFQKFNVPALHNERINPSPPSSSCPTWALNELDKLSLEEDLTHKLTLLREKIGSNEIISDLEYIKRVNSAMNGMDAHQAISDVSMLEEVPEASDIPVGAPTLYISQEILLGESQTVVMPRGGMIPGAGTIPITVPLSDTLFPMDHAQWIPFMGDVAIQGCETLDNGVIKTVEISSTVLIILILPEVFHHGIL